MIWLLANWRLALGGALVALLAITAMTYRIERDHARSQLLEARTEVARLNALGAAQSRAADTRTRELSETLTRVGDAYANALPAAVARADGLADELRRARAAHRPGPVPGDPQAAGVAGSACGVPGGGSGTPFGDRLDALERAAFVAAARDAERLNACREWAAALSELASPLPVGPR